MEQQPNTGCYPMVKISSAYMRLSELKPLDKPLKDATTKGNGYLKRLSKATAKMANTPKLVRRERINPKGSTFAFALIGQIPESGKYSRKRVTVTTNVVKVKRASKVGVQKSEKIETLMAKQPLLIGSRLTIQSGKLPTWYR